MWSLFQAHLIVSLVQNLRISIDIYFIEPLLIYPRGREYRSFARWSERKARVVELEEGHDFYPR